MAAEQGGGAAQLPTSISAEVNGYLHHGRDQHRAIGEPWCPAEKYTWQPTPDVRSFARIFAHIVDDNNGACAAIAGVTPPAARVDTGSAGNWAADKMTKADLEKALADSVALCQKAFAVDSRPT